MKSQVKLNRRKCKKCREWFKYDPSKPGRNPTKCENCTNNIREFDCSVCDEHIIYVKPGRLPSVCDSCKEKKEKRKQKRIAAKEKAAQHEDVEVIPDLRPLDSYDQLTKGDKVFYVSPNNYKRPFSALKYASEYIVVEIPEEGPPLVKRNTKEYTEIYPLPLDGRFHRHFGMTTMKVEERTGLYE